MVQRVQIAYLYRYLYLRVQIPSMGRVGRKRKGVREKGREVRKSHLSFESWLRLVFLLVVCRLLSHRVVVRIN